jgi:microcystin-dependent protein
MASGQPFDYVASVWSFGDRSTINAGLSRYLAAPGGTSLASELAAVALHAGTLKNLRWSCAASTLTGMGNRITLYVNGTATPLAATWNGPATSGSGSPDLVPVAPGDTLSVRIQLAAGAGNITRPRVSVELELPSAIPWLSNGADIYYAAGGNVGIGTGTPGETLSVKGTIESIGGGFRFPDGTLQTTAFETKLPFKQPPPPEPPIPPGSVIAYAGPSAPGGWLLCDGSLVGRAAFPGLFAAIGIAHGEGDASTTFALPDYRGMFLRGATGSSAADPDAGSRFAQGPGGNVGNAVGSKQWSQMSRHSHPVGSGSGDSFTMVPGNDPANTGRLASFVGDGWSSQAVHSTDQYPPYGDPGGSGSETRPSNAYVNFLIKT